MTDTPAALSGAECNGDRPPEDSQQHTSKLDEETTVVHGTPPYCRVEPDLEDSFTTGQQEENGKPQRNTLPKQPMGEKILNENPEENIFVVHKAVTDLSLQETSAEEVAFRSGNQWEKIPVSSGNQEVSRAIQKMAHQPLEDREDENEAYQAAAIEWLGFRKPSQVDMLHSKHDEEQEVWEEDIDEVDIDDCNDDEDTVRVIEFKKNQEEGSQLKEADEASEDSPLSSPSSQPVTPDEPLTLGKKGDISRSTYSRYNTISYRKIRKGNTKQRIDEFESMMHL